PDAGRDQRMNPASRRSASARQCGNAVGSDEVRHAALLGYPRQRREPLERHHPFHSAGVAGKEAAQTRRIRRGGGFRSGLQRGVSATAMDLSVVTFLALLLVVALLRFVELRISSRHQQEMIARGAAKVDEPKFRWMVLLHTAVLIGAALEVILLRRPFILWLAAPMFAIFLAANAVRWWVIRSLGEHWNVQVVDSTRLGVLTSGPFRYVRHPNYAAVFAEMLALPLIHTAWITAAAGAIAHTGVLAQRLSTEERVLFANPDYRAAMTGKPRFLPGLF